MSIPNIIVSRARRRGPVESLKINVFRTQRLHDMVRLASILNDQDDNITSNFANCLGDIRTIQNSAYGLLDKMKYLLSTR